jgi:Cupin-like domain
MMPETFSQNSLSVLAAAYPETPVKITHQMVNHPMLTLDVLVELASRLPEHHVEYNPGNLPIGIAPEDVPHPRLSITDTIRSIEENGSWMVLKFIEFDAGYRALLESALREVAPLTVPVTGEMLTMQGFIFISSPEAVTPFHFDPEHNILLQIRGNKVMTIFPAGDEALVSPVAHETFHLGGHRNLAWDDGFSTRGTPFTMVPGDAVYVPVKAPHWVKNGNEVSVSLSITWRSNWSYAESDARAFNALLRKAGMTPDSPGRYPLQNQAKSVAWRVLRKAGLAKLAH